MTNRLPIVAIIGRPNVGKSALFNRLVGAPRAIVAREAGTTRDRVETTMEWAGKTWLLVDTAGLYPQPKQSATPKALSEALRSQITEVQDAANVIVVVADGSIPLSQDDQRIAKLALKSAKPVVLVVNKMDKAEATADAAKRLGIKTVIAASATRKQGIEPILEAISVELPKVKSVASSTPALAITGRPNVGKSTLFNRLAGKATALVDTQAGTTRDLNFAVVKSSGGEIEIVDTGGIRRPGARRGIEQFSFLRTTKAIASCQVAAVVIDATEPSVALDQRIAGLVSDSGKGLIIVINKWDVVEDKETTRFVIEQQLASDFGFVWWAPVVFISAASGRNVERIPKLAVEIMKRRQIKLKTAQLNQALNRATAHHPPAGLKNRQPKLSYITQTGVAPPTFAIFGSRVEFLHWSYKRYLEAQLRQAFDFTGTPIKLIFRPKETKNEARRRSR